MKSEFWLIPLQVGARESDEAIFFLFQVFQRWLRWKNGVLAA